MSILGLNVLDALEHLHVDAVTNLAEFALTTTDAGPAFYTQPGRNLSAALQVDF